MSTRIRCCFDYNELSWQMKTQDPRLGLVVFELMSRRSKLTKTQNSRLGLVVLELMSRRSKLIRRLYWDTCDKVW